MSAERCDQTIYWWDANLHARCILRDGHRGPHSDGIRWFDRFGLQVPYTPQTPGYGRRGVVR